MTGMAKTKKGLARRAPKSVKTPAGRPSKKESKAKKIAGTVLKIVNGKPTKEKLSAVKAFGDLEQAREQVLYAERHGSLY
jgi:hypothetical protein